MAGEPRPTAHGELGSGRTNPFRFSGPMETIINPRKTKQKGLHFLGFLWWNRDFSMGYSESKQKNLLVQVFTKLRRNTRFPFVAQTRLAPGSPGSKKTIAHILIFDKTMRARNRAAMAYVSGQPIPHGWRWWPGRGDGIRPQAAAAEDRAGRISWLNHQGAGQQSVGAGGSDQAARALCAMRVSVNTFELSA